jgi:protein-L-isoaspartate(D-aspartate) O-methyltransferase
LIKTPEVELAFRGVDRCNFVADEQRANAYFDCAIDIGYNVQISAPHVHAVALGLLVQWLKQGRDFLDIGSGSGFMSAAMATIAGSCHEGSCVYGREHIPELAADSVDNIRKGNHALLIKETVAITAADGLSSSGKAIGGSGRTAVPAIFDAINCGAAFATIPDKLINQVKFAVDNKSIRL